MLPKIDRPYSYLITHSTGPIQKIQRIWRHRNEVLLLVLSSNYNLKLELLDD